MKRRGILLLTFLASINLISAFSIGEIFDAFCGENILLVGTFLIFFALLTIALGRFFKDDLGRTTNTPTVIAFVGSILITYFVYKLGLDLEGIFFSIGISSTLLYQIVNIAVLIGIIYLFWKFKSKLLFILGGLLIILSGTNLVEGSETLFTLGIGLLILGVIIKFGTKILGIFKGKGRITNVAKAEIMAYAEDKKRATAKSERIHDQEEAHEATKQEQIQRDRKAHMMKKAEQEAYAEDKRRAKAAKGSP